MPPLKPLARKFLKIFTGMFGRVPLVYLIGYLIFYTTLDYENTMNRVKGSALSRLMPYHLYLVKYLSGEIPYQQERFVEYVHYYRQVIDYMPYTADAFGMLGLCYYHMQEKGKAIAAFKRAIELNPHFFWFYYNLGAFYYKDGRYEEAVELFKQAMTTESDAALSFIYISKIYLPIRDITQDYQNTINLRLEAAYRHCYQMVILTQYQLRDFQGVVGSANYAIREKFEDLAFYYFYSGLAAYELKEYPVAISLLQDCLALRKDYREAYQYLASAWLALGKKDIASQLLRQEVLFGRIESPKASVEKKLFLKIF